MTTSAAPSYLANAICVASFKLDRDLRFKAKEIEQNFNAALSAQAIGTNVPDSAPPLIPRFTLQSGPKQITVSQVTAQIELNFKDQAKTSAESIEIIKKNFKHFWHGIFKFKGAGELKDVGMVITLNRPLDLSSAEISKKIFDKFLTMPIHDDVVSAGLQVGFLDKSDQVFFNISANPYEMREIPFDSSNVDPSVVVDFESLPIKESGIELKLDVNSKPMFQAGVAVTEELGDKLFRRLKILTDDYEKKIIEW